MNVREEGSMIRLAESGLFPAVILSTNGQRMDPTILWRITFASLSVYYANGDTQANCSL